MTLTMIMGVCGCMSNNRQNSAEEMQDNALTYLTNKYDDNFTSKGYSPSNWAYEYSSITFISEKYPDSVVEVRAYKNDDGTYSYQDNYFKCFMYDEAVAYFKSIVVGVYPLTVKVRFPSTVWSDELNNASSFTEWKANGNCTADVFFITHQNLSDEDKNKVVHNIADNNISGTITFFTTSNGNNLLDEPLDDILNNQSSFIEGKCEFYINSKFEIE